MTYDDAHPLYNHELTGQVLGCAIEVHRNLGPGLLESAYRKCLVHELGLLNLGCKAEVSLPIEYKGAILNCEYRMDIVVEDFLVIEIKAVETVLPIHHAQLLTYMKLAELPIGLLLNFNVKLLKDGISKLIL